LIGDISRGSGIDSQKALDYANANISEIPQEDSTWLQEGTQ
jgi:hypothetical protein